MALFVGDDWAEDHHDVAVMDAAGRVLAKARLPEGVAGMARVHALIGAHAGKDEQNEEVLVGIETERGGWVAALLAAGYTVYAVNPLQAARYRERHSVSGAKSDVADARMLADMVRTDAPRLRALAPDSALAEAVKVLSRAHKTLIWERTRHTQRLRHALLEYFPAVLDAFADLDAPDTLALLRIAPDPVAAAKLTRSQIRAVLKTARRRNLDANTTRIQAVLRGEYLRRDPIVVTAYAASTRASAAVLAALNTQITELEGQLHDHFGRHPDAEIITSLPGLGSTLGARVLAEFGDASDRYHDAKARKNYAGTSPVTRQSGKTTITSARWVHNDHLVDALLQQAFSALSSSPGARAYYDKQRARRVDHYPALRQLANRLVGILHGCLKTRTPYDETTAWSHHTSNISNTSTAA